MYTDISRAIAHHFHAEHLSTWEPVESDRQDYWAFVFRLPLSRIVPDSHRASWSNNIFVDSRQRVYFLEVYVPKSMLSIDWVNRICDQMEQQLSRVTFSEVNPTLRITITGAPSAAAI